MVPPLCPQCENTQGTETDRTWVCTQCGYVAPRCFHWGNTGYSPGEPTPFLDTLALGLFNQIERFGWEQVMSLRTIELTEDEGEGLLRRLEWMANFVARLRAERAQEQ